MWPTCWLAAPYGYPPRGTPFAAPIDILDFLLAFYLLFLYLSYGPQVSELGFGRNPDWERIAIATLAAVVIGGIGRFLAWAPFRYFRNSHVVIAATGTHRSCPPAGAMYAWSSIGHWPRMGWGAVFASGLLVLGTIAQQYGDHRSRLVAAIEHAGWWFGFVVVSVIAAWRIAPWYFSSPRVARFRSWFVDETADLFGKLAESGLLGRQRREERERQQLLHLPNGEVRERAARSTGDGLAEVAQTVAVRMKDASVEREAATAWWRAILQVVWFAIPFVFSVVVGAFAGEVIESVLGGIGAIIGLGIRGSIKALALSIIQGALATIIMLGTLSTARMSWRLCGEAIRWIVLRPSGPYVVTV